jgi:Thioredoxin like C-terminal domain
VRSPESYTGYEQAVDFASPGGLAPDQRQVYAAPERLRLNHWALSGDWTVDSHAATANTAGGRISYRFHARDVNLVMGPAARGTSVPFQVFVDGQPAGAAHGTEVDEQGRGTVTEQRTYQLIRQPGPVADRTFEIAFLEPGAQAFCFTFG